jgi:hypothetical protein
LFFELEHEGWRQFKINRNVCVLTVEDEQCNPALTSLFSSASCWCWCWTAFTRCSSVGKVGVECCWLQKESNTAAYHFFLRFITREAPASNTIQGCSHCTMFKTIIPFLLSQSWPPPNFHPPSPGGGYPAESHVSLWLQNPVPEHCSHFLRREEDLSKTSNERRRRGRATSFWRR